MPDTLPPHNPADTKLLVVEDDTASAFVLETILLRAGYTVLPVAHGSEAAVEAARQHRPDIILMDINIPGPSDGVETAQAIRKFHDVPLIYLTGFSDERTIERAKRTAPFAYILKPFREKEVAITIQMALYKSRMDRQIRASEHRLAVTLGSLNDGVISTDPRGEISYMNPAAETLASTRLEAARALPVDQILDLRNAQSRTPLTNAAGFLFSDDYTSQRNDPVLMTGSRGDRLVQVQTSPTTDPGGTITSWVIVLRDVTERDRAERQNRLMASALESQEDAVLLFEASGEDNAPRLVHANVAFERISGFSKTEATAHGLAILAGGRDEVPGDAALRRCLQRGQHLTGEGVYFTKNGDQLMGAWSVSPVRADGRTLSHVVFTLRDVTRLRHLEENIRQSQKIEAVGRLAGGIAHDFNNLLSVINSYSELLSLKVDAEGDLAKYVKNIRTAGERGATLVNQLMTFSRREDASPSLLHLSDVAHETRQLLRPLIREDIALEVAFPADLPAIHADRSRIEQVLVNLCLNARDAITGPGNIHISGAQVAITEADNDTEFRQPGDYVQLEVRDDGSGMDAEVRDHLFEPFFTTKDVGQGTGLGLATVYGIVKQSGGYIEVESEPGEGACFRIFLPALREEPDAATSTLKRPTRKRPVENAHGSETILLIEDDDTFADCISGLLSLHGYVVHCVNDGTEAVQRFGEKADELKLLLTDIVLPGTSGTEVAEHFARANANLKVLFMTGYEEEPKAVAPLPPDTVTLRKPFSLNVVLDHVRNLLDAQKAPEARSPAAASTPTR
ncbi:MAG: response regulator [Opitutales bacterium]